MLNYRISPELLAPLVPAGTELDLWNGDAFVSMLGFRFLRTRVLGLPIPFHGDFDEVNLRFYVRRTHGDHVHRGVVFIKELVPRSAVALLANWMYNESYSVTEIRHSVPPLYNPPRTPDTVEFSFRQKERHGRIAVTPAGASQETPKGGLEEYIAFRLWGYSRQRDGGTYEYHVRHPRWNMWEVSDSRLEANLTELYGLAFAEVLSRPPDSAYLADGSPISVTFPRRIA
jgi:uncharacterized protein YqjF (DUF2071 family)